MGYDVERELLMAVSFFWRKRAQDEWHKVEVDADCAEFRGSRDGDMKSRKKHEEGQRKEYGVVSQSPNSNSVRRSVEPKQGP